MCSNSVSSCNVLHQIKTVKMKIEITATTNNIKQIFNIETVQINVAKTLQSNENETALEKLLQTEPATVPLEIKPHLSNLLNEYRQVFALFDKDDDGKVSKQELHFVMLALRQTIKFTELDDVLRMNNVQDEYFSFAQFIDILQIEHSDENIQELKDTFRVFDKRNTGYINASDLTSVCQCFDIDLTREEIDEMINEVDIDGDGRISFDEFVCALSTIEENENITGSSI